MTDPSVFVRMPVAADSPWPSASGRHAAGVDHHTVDAGVQHRRGGVPDRGVLGDPHLDGEVLVVAEELRERVAPESEVLATLTGTELEHTGYVAPFDLVDVPEAHYVILGDYVTTEDGSGLVHIARPSAPTTCSSPAAMTCRWSTRCTRTAPSTRRSRWSAACSSGTPTHPGRGPARARAALPQGGLRAQLPALLALHTALLYYAQPSWYIRTTAVKGRAAARERRHQLVPQHHQGRPLRRLAGQQHRLGAVPQPLLGHPLPLWRCPPGTSPPWSRCST